MDGATTKTLSVHMPALLPPTSTELNIPHNVQVAAVLGVGLVYQGTAHSHMSEVLLAEIGQLGSFIFLNVCFFNSEIQFSMLSFFVTERPLAASKHISGDWLRMPESGCENNSPNISE
jgi:hypothetical protein